MVYIALWMVWKIIIFKHKISMFIRTHHLVPQKRKIRSNFYLVQLIPFSNLLIKFIMARHLLLSNLLDYTTLVLSRRYVRQQKVEEIKKQKVQFFKEVAVPTKAKRLLTCGVTKSCYAMLRQVNIWTGRRKIKQSKKLQKHGRPIKKLF